MMQKPTENGGEITIKVKFDKVERSSFFSGLKIYGENFLTSVNLAGTKSATNFSMKKTYQIANGIAAVFTIIFNYLSNTGIFAGKSIGEVSNEIENLFTPAGYAFSIWGLIYLLLLGFVIYTGRSLFQPNNTEADGFVEKIGWWFILTCVANCAWIVTWLYGYTGVSVLIMIVFLVALLKILVEALKYRSGVAQKWLINTPFQIYAGWVSVALIAAAAAWLAKIGWSAWGISEISWTIIMIFIAVLINLYMTWKKDAPVFAFAAVWALIAIAVANKSGSNEIYTMALSCAALLFLSSCDHLYKRRTLI